MRRWHRNDAFVLKHRLAGAAILIGFAVIVLPMLLGGPQTNDSNPDDGGMRGASDTKVFRSNITPIGGETPSLAGRPRGEADAGSDREADRPAPPPPAGDDAPQTATAEENDTDTAEEAVRDDQRAALESDSGDGGSTGSGRAQSIERGWIVQVGTFRNQDNVEKIVARLENGGFDSSSTEVETSDGVATRVWVGPFETRVEAARIKSRVKQRTGSEGLIVAYP